MRWGGAAVLLLLPPSAAPAAACTCLLVRVDGHSTRALFSRFCQAKVGTWVALGSFLEIVILGPLSKSETESFESRDARNRRREGRPITRSVSWSSVRIGFGQVDRARRDSEKIKRRKQTRKGDLLFICRATDRRDRTDPFNKNS